MQIGTHDFIKTYCIQPYTFLNWKMLLGDKICLSISVFLDPKRCRGWAASKWAYKIYRQFFVFSRKSSLIHTQTHRRTPGHPNIHTQTHRRTPEISCGSIAKHELFRNSTELSRVSDHGSLTLLHLPFENPN